MIRIPITSSSTSSSSSSSARGVLKSTKGRSAQRKTTTTTFTISNRVSAPPNPKTGSDVDVRVFCPSKVSRICRKKRRRREGPGGPEDEEPPFSSSPGDYEMFEDDEEDEGELDDGGDDDGFDDISNDGRGDGGGGDDENDDDEDDDDEFDEKWENIIKRLEDNYQNLEALKTVSDPYAGLNGVSGELSVIWSAGCVVTYASAIAHSLDTMISPFIKGENDGYVDIA